MSVKLVHTEAYKFGFKSFLKKKTKEFEFQKI